jgi:hypothetical protein
VPSEDVGLIGHVLAAAPPTSRVRRGALRRARRAEIDACWPGEPYDSALYSAALAPLDRLDSLPAGAEHTVTVTVANSSSETWHYGSDAAPLIMVGTRWLDDDGSLLEEGVHTPLPADLPPGCSLEVPVHVRAPARPGSYRLSIDLVHEHVRWFESAIEWPLDVPPARRVAVLGEGAALEDALDRVHLEPELEPVLLPSVGGYLLAGIEARIGPLELARLMVRTARLMRCARRIRAGKPYAPLGGGADEFLTTLERCTRLLVVGPDWERHAAVTRQLWRLAATIEAARTLGLAVAVRLPDFTPTGPVDRLLTRLVTRPRDSSD